jgi:hypothetical protein
MGIHPRRKNPPHRTPQVGHPEQDYAAAGLRIGDAGRDAWSVGFLTAEAQIERWSCNALLANSISTFL